MTEQYGFLMGRKGEVHRDPFDIIIGASLRAARLEQALSVTAVASALGISRQRLSQYEDGSRSLKVRMLTPICLALHLPPTELIGDLDRAILRPGPAVSEPIDWARGHRTDFP